MYDIKHMPIVITVFSRAPGKTHHVQTSYLTQEKKIKTTGKTFINCHTNDSVKTAPRKCQK